MDKMFPLYKHHENCTDEQCHIDCPVAAAGEKQLPEFNLGMGRVELTEELMLASPVDELHNLLPFESVKEILGRPNFTCISIANFLRMQGQQIDTKAEAEQAAAIYHLLELFTLYGKEYFKKFIESVEEYLSKKKEAAKQAPRIHACDTCADHIAECPAKEEDVTYAASPSDCILKCKHYTPRKG